MHALPPVPIDDRHLYLSGEVIVHESAVIAPGVLLQADPGSRLTIEAGVCVGTGSILHAHRGTLTLEAGAIVGNGVLVVGTGTIGSQACIGPFSTIISCSVAAKQLIPPHSLLGDQSRQVDLTALPVDAPDVVEPPKGTEAPAAPSEQPPAESPSIANGFRSGAAFRAGVAFQSGGAFRSGGSFQAEASFRSEPSPPVEPPPSDAGPTDSTPTGHAVQPPEPDIPSPPVEPPAQKALTQVYGQAYVERIMITMFPHRRSLDADSEISQSEFPNPPP